MKLFLSIVGIIVVSVLVFIGLAMAEEWDVFEPWMAGRSAAPATLPGDAELIAVIRAFSGAIERGDIVGPERSPARQILQEDFLFRRRFGVRQHLVLDEVAIESKRSVGPATLKVITRERSHLSIGRVGGAVRHYVVEGTWTYTVRESAGGLEVVDFAPLDARLVDSDDDAEGKR